MAEIQIPVKRTAKQGERQLQAQCVAWFRYQYPQFERLLVSIPNGTKFIGSEKQRAIMGKRFKDEGMLPGASDLFLFVPSGELHGLAIEMKLPKGVQSDNQCLFEAAIIEQGYGYVMPRTFEQFVKAVNMYLETGEY
mgnify:FL=1